MHNLDNYITTTDFYQVQLNNDKVIVKHVAHGDKVGDVLISKNFGIDNKYSLYASMFKKEDLEDKKFMPVIYLTDGIRYYYISVLLNSNIIEVEHSDFELYFVCCVKNQTSFKIDKNIDKNNIFEKLFLILKNRGIDILH